MPPKRSQYIFGSMTFFVEYNLTPEDLDFDDPSLLYHRISEGLKFAIGRAMVLGDDSPEFTSPEMEQVQR